MQRCALVDSSRPRLEGIAAARAARLMDLNIQRSARAGDRRRVGHRARDGARVRARGCARARLRRRRCGARRAGRKRPRTHAQRLRRRRSGRRRAPVRRSVSSTLGGLDALVNNAGIAGPTARVRGRRAADWERTLAVNLTGQFLCAQRAIPLLKASAQRQHRQPLLGGGPLRLSQSDALRRVEVGRDRVHEVAVDRARPARHSRQRDLPRLGRRRADRRRVREQGGSCAASRRCRARRGARQDVAEAAGHRRGHRERDRVPRVAARREHLRARAARRRAIRRRSCEAHVLRPAMCALCMAALAVRRSSRTLRWRLRARRGARDRQAQGGLHCRARQGLGRRESRVDARQGPRSTRWPARCDGGSSLSDHTQVVFADGITSQALAQRLAEERDVEFAVPDRAPHVSRCGRTIRSTRAANTGTDAAPPGSGTCARRKAKPYRRSTPKRPGRHAGQPGGRRGRARHRCALRASGSSCRERRRQSSARLRHGQRHRRPRTTVTAATPTRRIPATGCPPTTRRHATTQPRNSSWHGTKTAGLVAALTNNGVGIASVGRAVRVLPVRVLGKCGGYDSDIIAGMRWAAALPVPGVPREPLSGCGHQHEPRLRGRLQRRVSGCGNRHRRGGHRHRGLRRELGRSCRSRPRELPWRDRGRRAAPYRHEGGLFKPGTGDRRQRSGRQLRQHRRGRAVPLSDCDDVQFRSARHAAESVYTDGVAPSLGTSFAAPLVSGTVGIDAVRATAE